MHLFEPQHINATQQDFFGNNGIGRYIILVGSDQRAEEIGKMLHDTQVKTHARRHNLYLGQLNTSEHNIDVAVVSSGMGSASADIIINELLLLGAKRLLRIGTAGSLQPERVKTGDIVIASAAVRDDKSSWDYIYPEFPAITSQQWLTACSEGSVHIQVPGKLWTGIIHTKSSLYAREMGQSFLEENEQYMRNVRLAGVLATEMETAQLFILSTLYNAKQKLANNQHIEVLSGSILAVVGDHTPYSNNKELVNLTIMSVINLGLEAIKKLDVIDKQATLAHKLQLLKHG